jgi:protein-S-isoprenylcysteine O-methyltransferase Ste14
VIVLLRAFVRFVREGRGTPAPIAPTERLVIGGDYRFVRNPMYVGVVAAVLGQALLFLDPWLFAYAVAGWAVMASFGHWYEVPVLRKRYGSQYEEYCKTVPAWLPRVRP